MFPGKELPETGREVRSLAGARTSLREPLPLTIQICGVTLSHPVYFCENVKTFLLGYDVVSPAALVIYTDARCVYSKFTADQRASQRFVSPPTPLTSVQSSAVESVPSACDAATCTSDCSSRPCESPRPFCPRFVAASSSASAKLGDSARALANSTRTAHCNDACTPRSSLVQPFSLQRDVTLPPAALPRSTVACSQDDFAPVASVTPPFCSDCHAPTAAESVPAVGTFSHDEPSEFSLDMAVSKFTPEVHK